MICLYYYKGKPIGNIRDLDTFLLEKLKYYNKLGDIVFSHESRAVHSIARLKTAALKSAELEKVYNEAKKMAKYTEGEERLTFEKQRPYVGVSEFLSGLTNSQTGKLYFPEFIAENYWKERFYEWAKGTEESFTEDEIELFFDGDKSKITAIELGNPNDWRDANGVLKLEFGTDELKRLRAMMEEKWKKQSEYGTEIHNVLQQYFSKTKEGKMRYLLWEDPKIGDMQLKLSIKYMRDAHLITDATDDTKIKQIIEYAKDLRHLLESQYGKEDGSGIEYFPEFTLSADLNKTYTDANGVEITKILGRADLIIIDKNGTPHIVDYKTSPRPYELYKEAKKLGFTYLLATYERMLRRWGLNTTKTDIVVAPIKLGNFRKIDGLWTYDNVEKGNSTSSPLESLNEAANSETINTNLDDFIEAPLIIDGDSENIINKVSKLFKTWFPDYLDINNQTDEEIRAAINEQEGFKLNPSTGNYEYTPKGAKTPIIATAIEGEGKLFERVRNFYVSNRDRTVKNTKELIKILKKAQTEDGELVLFPNGMDEWVGTTLSKYCNSHWLVMEDSIAAEAALQYGIILLYNPELDLIDTVKISGHYLKPIDTSKNHNLNITRLWEDDNIENSKSDSLILKAATGNLEMIETMLVLNNLQFNNNIKLGRMQVISPFADADGLSASNEELKYTWNKLNNLSPLEDSDNYNNGKIKLVSKTEQCYLEFKEILDRVKILGGLKDRYQPLESLSENLYSAVKVNNKEASLKALHELRKKLEESFGMHKDIDREGNNYHEKYESYSRQYSRTLYQLVMAAILDLNNITPRQSLEDHKDYFQSVHIFTKGISGNRMDNANNFGNELLNKVTSIVLEGYQNARDLATSKLYELRRRTEQLKKDSGYNPLLEHTVGNLTSLYDEMTEYTLNGDLKFINPWANPKNLNSKLTEYLKYIITEVNKLRHPEYSEAQIEEKIKSNDIEFFEVPLIKASFASKINTDGWLGWLKNTFKMFSSKEQFKQTLRDSTTKFLSDADELETIKNTAIFESINMINRGYGNNRLKLILEARTKYGDGFYERDLESILSTVTWSCSTANALQDRMPLLKAAYISLAVMGNQLNYSFKNDEKFIKDFVNNRVNSIQIDDERLRPAKAIVNQLQLAVSWMALAFSPVLFSYLMLEGIWKDAKLIITKPDGTESFTFPNMKAAAKTVYLELFYYSDTPSISTAVNSLYGINDMDKAAFAENNSSNNHGIFNFFGKFAYRFSSRPDFYNRMTIFVSQMMHDGSWKAHKINPKTNLLEYNWREDERFKAYAEDSSNKEAYNKARALYYATALQLVREGARNADGSLFVLGEKVALPKAYSNKESEAMKAVGDTMYGYYDSTKKSMMQSTLLGGLVMLMKTYWSAKKNQYFAPGGIKALGKWEQAKNEKGEELFYAITETGDIDNSKMPVPKSDPSSSDIPFMQWKGKFEEGVMLTFYDLIKECIKARSFKDGWENKMHNANTDPEVLKTYASNLKLLVTDLLMWAAIGGSALLLADWADDEEKEFKKSGNLDDAIDATFAGLVTKTVRNSSMDFAWWNSIFDITLDWNPMSLAYLAKTAKNTFNTIVGDEEASDLIIKSFSAARLMRPMFEFIGQEE